MPIAFKEWAVTVRALAEGEQLLTLRKGGLREPGREFRLAHERFFLYPTFEHQTGDLVRESHQPELRRALEEGVWSDGERPAPPPGGAAAAPGGGRWGPRGSRRCTPSSPVPRCSSPTASGSGPGRKSP